ncbi:MAG: NUDIX domain-containing protein [Rikenellaceae bacterium]
MKNKTIYAAGGVVTNPQGEYLLIYRNGIWDLPKGKREEGESDEQCALREVSEECGLPLSGLTLGDKIMTTTHFYHLNIESVTKHTQWYMMEYCGSAEPKAQKEEGIERVCWVDQQKAKECLDGSYETIKELFEKVLNLVK